MLGDPLSYAGNSSVTPTFPAEAKCQELNVFYTCVTITGRNYIGKSKTDPRHRGFAAYHPYVAAQNMKETLQEIDMGLRSGTYELLKAGYNVQGITSRLQSI
jgi:hypothetical protein